MYLLALLMLMFTACSSDDNESQTPDGTFPAELIGTWDMGGGHITFRDNMTGVMTFAGYSVADVRTREAVRSFRPQKASGTTIEFKWTYSATDSRISLIYMGQTEVWTLVSLANGTLVVRDSDGETITMQRASGTDNDGNDDDDDTGIPTGGEVGPAYLLTGTWGAAGRKFYTFANNGTILYHYIDEQTGAETYESGAYVYDENNHILTIEDMGRVQVTAMTEDVIRLTFIEDGSSLWLSRITDGEKYTVGPLSLIYDKKLTMIGVASLDNEPTVITVTIRSSGEYVMSVNSMTMTYKYRYDESTRTLTVSAPDGTVVQTSTVIRLTEKVVFLRTVYDDEGETEVMTAEYRAL